MNETAIKELQEIKGLGNAKIAQIKAALEIARRFDFQDRSSGNKKVTTTDDIVRIFRKAMLSYTNEKVKLICCDVKNRITDIVDIASGTPTECYPVIREIISIALQKSAASIICIHNHPKGNALPSKNDISFTKSLKAIASPLDISLLDHVIFGENSYYSFDLDMEKEYSDAL